ncbi:N-acetylmuramoyl-L-alanine amidase, partial [Sphingomonas sp.]|uniref:N-acetylmuramoyl-L-alanine amidase n=1 Tax=Sphingomonas sp. TaxID=28214 RepID=UPI001D270D77
MAFTISGGMLRQGAQRVEFIKSLFTSGSFAAMPSIAVIHFTAGASGRSSAEWFRNRQNPGSSAHVVVDRDGSVIQCVAFDTVAQHAGRSRWRDLAGRELVGLNRFSFGIELANWGDLRRAGSGWASHTGVPIASPVLAVHRGGNPDGSRTPIGWEPFPAPQIDTAVAIVRALVSAFGVNEIVGHDDIAPTRKFDPGPAFDMVRFRARVFGGRADDGDTLMKVAVA